MNEDTPTNEAPENQGQGEGQVSSSWIEDIPEDLTYEVKGDNEEEPKTIPLREHAKLKEFQDVGSLAKSFLEAQRLIGKKAGLKPLPKDASEDERTSWEKELRQLLGVPESPKEYELVTDEGTPENEQVLETYREIGFKHGLSPQQLQGVYDDFMAFSKEYWANETEALAKQEKEAQEAEMKAALDAVKKAWGDNAERNTEVAKRGFVAVAEKAGISKKDSDEFLSKYGNNIVMLKMFQAIGESFVEDSSAHGSTSGTAVESEAAALKKLYPTMPPEAFNQT